MATCANSSASRACTSSDGHKWRPMHRFLHHVMCLPARVTVKEQTSRDGNRKDPRRCALLLTCTIQDPQLRSAELDEPSGSVRTRRRRARICRRTQGYPTHRGCLSRSGGAGPQARLVFPTCRPVALCDKAFGASAPDRTQGCLYFQYQAAYTCAGLLLGGRDTFLTFPVLFHHWLPG